MTSATLGEGGVNQILTFADNEMKMHFYALSMIQQEVLDKNQIHIWQIYLKKAFFLAKGKLWQALHIRKITV